MNPQGRNIREGSIPMILIVVTVLGIFAASSLFMSSGQARLDKKAEFKAMAQHVAQSAVEEILVKFSNNKIKPFDDKKTSWAPNVTRLTYPSAKVGEVVVLQRQVDAPNDGAKLEEFNHLITALPGFAANHDEEWWKGEAKADPAQKVMTLDPTTLTKTVSTGPGLSDKHKEWIAQMPFYDAANASKMYATDPNEAAQYKGMIRHPQSGDAGEEYLDEHWKEYRGNGDLFDTAQGKEGQDANRGGNAGQGIRDAVKEIPQLAIKEWWKAPDLADSSILPDEAARSSSQTCHTKAELDAFKQDWDTAMDKFANRVADRIANCAGNPNYGVGARMAAFALGVAADADGEAEETLRNTSQDSGVLGYKANLLTLETKASVGSTFFSAEQPVTAHRMVTTISLVKSMDIMRGNLVPYLMYHYNLTPLDLQDLGFIAPMKANPTDPAIDLARLQSSAAAGGSILVPKPEMLTKLDERYPDNPSPYVFPFQLATCLDKRQE